MRRFCLSPVLALLAAAALLPGAGLAAQAPDITPSGDPSVASDTIYKLAVDSAAYPQQSSVLLLDDGVVRVERDGRTTTTYRQVIQILRERAVAGRREEEFGYDADRQRFRLNWARVVTPDGKIISEKPAQMQESDVPAAMDIPMYQHARVVRASLSGVAVGTLVDVSYTIETRSVDRTGDFYNSWRVTAGTMVRRSRFLVDAPADMPLTIAERHLTFKRSEQVVHGRRVYTWATKDVAWTKPERFAPDTVQQTQWVSLSAPGHWSDVGSWYMGLAHDRELAPNALRDTVKRLTANAKTRDDSIRAVHRWVAQDIRYVAIELGKGGYQPRLPATVMQTGFGDCKDKATLFVAALRAIGIDAYHDQGLQPRDRRRPAPQRRLSVRRPDVGAQPVWHDPVCRRRRVRADRAARRPHRGSAHSDRRAGLRRVRAAPDEHPGPRRHGQRLVRAAGHGARRAGHARDYADTHGFDPAGRVHARDGREPLSRCARG
jgi:transglutaminase-like putative cysteine protease